MVRKKILKLIPPRWLSYYRVKRNHVTLNNVSSGAGVFFAAHSNISNTEIRDYTSIGRYTKIVNSSIGKYCSISWDITINATSHTSSTLSTHSFCKRPDYGFGVLNDLRQHKTVIIKNDVWIGANSVIMPGITIGNGAIIGAGAVVTKDVPDYAIVAGVPAKIIKYRFDQHTIDRLLDLKWWDLDPKIIKQNISLWQKELHPGVISELENISTFES